MHSRSHKRMNITSQTFHHLGNGPFPAHMEPAFRKFQDSTILHTRENGFYF